MFGMPKSKYEKNWVKSSVHGAHKVCLFHFLTMPQCDSEINSNLLVQRWTVAKLSVMTWGKPKFKVCHSSTFLGKKNKMVLQFGGWVSAWLRVFKILSMTYSSVCLEYTSFRTSLCTFCVITWDLMCHTCAEAERNQMGEFWDDFDATVWFYLGCLIIMYSIEVQLSHFWAQ